MLPLSLVFGGPVVVGLIAGAAILLWSLRRGSRPSVREGAARTAIGELEPGRYRVTGRVVPIRTTPSEIDGSPCVYLERAQYAPVGGGLVPLLREVGHGYSAHSFYLDDGSGRILIDPASTLIDCATLVGDGGLVAERRLRAGEEIELIASFRASEGMTFADLDEGPYRQAASMYEPGPDGVGPPRITYRTEQGMERTGIDDLTSLWRGLGALMIAISALFGGTMLWLEWFVNVG